MLIRRAIPCVLIVLGLIGLVGCMHFHLSIPEHSANSSEKDFRPLIDENNASSPIRAGKITRDGIISLLGAPLFEIPEQHALVYQYTTEADAEIYPLCFSIQPGMRTSFAVKFTFDHEGRLEYWATDSGSGCLSSLSIVMSQPGAAERFRPRHIDSGGASTTTPTTSPSPR